ncbi:HAD-IC family P-type ATPase [Mucilaginibacter metallidurans]|uniref:HAD-IC family P-type ATPase n=1 Tax=Mucilaginibacter sp. P4 TaxID=3383180 RepID=UPI0021CE7D57|nr:HAD-IC family P-type ATPase [Mucilaginibacter gossypii]
MEHQHHEHQHEMPEMKGHDHAQHQERNGMGHGDMGHAGHDHGAMIADFRKRFYVVLAFTLPILALSPMIRHWLHLQIGFPGDRYVLFALSTAVFLYGGRPFLTGWLSELKAKNPGMMTLIGFAISVAYLYSAATVFGLKGMDFFWELDTLILIMLLGHWIEIKSIAGASRELELLVQLMPSAAHVLKGDITEDVKTESLKENDLILIKPGEKVPADGMVEDGESYLNESMLTGESAPVQKTKGQQVIAGSVNGNGSLKVRVTHSGKDSYLFKVIDLVRDAQNAKSNTQLLADKAARWLTIIALLAGITTFVVWISLGTTWLLPWSGW